MSGPVIFIADAPERGRDRRRSPRRNVTLGGQLYFGLCGLSMDCVIRDISEHGARVAAPKRWQAPKEVQLLSMREGRVYRARVVWNRGRYLALDFTSVHELASEDDPEFAEMRAAWLSAREPVSA